MTFYNWFTCSKPRVRMAVLIATVCTPLNVLYNHLYCLSQCGLVRPTDELRSATSTTACSWRSAMSYDATNSSVIPLSDWQLKPWTGAQEYELSVLPPSSASTSFCSWENYVSWLSEHAIKVTRISVSHDTISFSGAIAGARWGLISEVSSVRSMTFWMAHVALSFSLLSLSSLLLLHTRLSHHFHRLKVTFHVYLLHHQDLMYIPIHQSPC